MEFFIQGNVYCFSSLLLKILVNMLFCDFFQEHVVFLEDIYFTCLLDMEFFIQGNVYCFSSLLVKIL